MRDVVAAQGSLAHHRSHASVSNCSDSESRVELKNGSEEGEEPRRDDGHELPAPKHQKQPRLNKRAEIEATLRRLHDADCDQRQRDVEARDAQRDHTRSLVKLMHLDTADQAKIASHTAKVSIQNEIASIMDTMRRIEERYQAEKKHVATIQDKGERHGFVEKAKATRNAAMAPLRERLLELDPDARPPTSYEQQSTSCALPMLQRGRKTTSAMFRHVSDQIRHLQKTRKTMDDPYMANLKMAKLWMKINDPERALENYEKAIKSLSERDRSKIPEEDLPGVLEAERRRKREALKFLFLRALDLQERSNAAQWMRQFLELSTTSERLPSVAYLESLLRSLEYVEDPSLASPEAVSVSILCSKSLGVLTDLRFELLHELLDASPNDPYLLESVANMHVRKHDFRDAKAVGDRFVMLPQVKRMQFFSSFAEFSPTAT